MDNLSTRKQHPKRAYDASITASKKTQAGYNMDLGFWGQPRSFYAGLASGFVFLLAMLGFLLSILSRI